MEYDPRRCSSPRESSCCSSGSPGSTWRPSSGRSASAAAGCGGCARTATPPRPGCCRSSRTRSGSTATSRRRRSASRCRAWRSAPTPRPSSRRASRRWSRAGLARPNRRVGRQRRRAHLAHDGLGRRRRDGARRPSRCGIPTETALVTTLPMLWSAKALRLVHRHSRSQRRRAALAAARAVGDAPPRALAGRDRAAHRREPRRRAARAAGAGPAAPRASPRTARRAAVDGAARASRGDRAHDADARRAPHRRHAARTAGCRSFAHGLDDIAGILHTKDVVTHFLERGRSGTLAALIRPILRVPDTMPADRLLGFLRERRSHQALVVDAPTKWSG